MGPQLEEKSTVTTHELKRDCKLVFEDNATERERRKGPESYRRHNQVAPSLRRPTIG